MYLQYTIGIRLVYDWYTMYTMRIRYVYGIFVVCIRYVYECIRLYTVMTVFVILLPIMVTGFSYFNYKQVETNEILSIYGCDRVTGKNRVNGEHRANGKNRIEFFYNQTYHTKDFSLSNFWKRRHGMLQSTIKNSYPSKWSS